MAQQRDGEDMESRERELTMTSLALRKLVACLFQAHRRFHHSLLHRSRSTAEIECGALARLMRLPFRHHHVG
jgi:hypothetical protein